MRSKGGNEGRGEIGCDHAKNKKRVKPWVPHYGMFRLMCSEKSEHNKRHIISHSSGSCGV